MTLEARRKAPNCGHGFPAGVGCPHNCRIRTQIHAKEKKIYAICKFVTRPGPCSAHVYEAGEVCCGWHKLVKPTSCKA